ncbi:82 prophage-derived uncharacterized protein ybcO [Klebsiella pneumoniae]|uniref:82 prophage-derived uncharacterized protein ybcO n=1 Tax=Klebsiella pneumoniae TaxID=573 RepID=A0A377XGS9_KLEPN|nr:82 prophage-derived uncharacterized protein ybcO [Klebsiella pneumoniae]
MKIDRRTRLVDAEYAKECALEGMARTQVYLDERGVDKSMNQYRISLPWPPSNNRYY